MNKARHQSQPLHLVALKGHGAQDLTLVVMLQLLEQFGLERDGVEITNELIEAITLFVKDARQKRTRSDKFTTMNEAYYREYDRLGISELRLVELASTIGRMLQEGLFPKPPEPVSKTVPTVPAITNGKEELK